MILRQDREDFVRALDSDHRFVVFPCDEMRSSPSSNEIPNRGLWSQLMEVDNEPIVQRIERDNGRSNDAIAIAVPDKNVELVGYPRSNKDQSRECEPPVQHHWRQADYHRASTHNQKP